MNGCNEARGLHTRRARGRHDDCLLSCAVAGRLRSWYIDFHVSGSIIWFYVIACVVELTVVSHSSASSCRCDIRLNWFCFRAQLDSISICAGSCVWYLSPPLYSFRMPLRSSKHGLSQCVGATAVMPSLPMLWCLRCVCCSRHPVCVFVYLLFIEMGDYFLYISIIACKDRHHPTYQHHYYHAPPQ